MPVFMPFALMLNVLTLTVCISGIVVLVSGFVKMRRIELLEKNGDRHAGDSIQWVCGMDVRVWCFTERGSLMISRFWVSLIWHRFWRKFGRAYLAVNALWIACWVCALKYIRDFAPLYLAKIP